MNRRNTILVIVLFLMSASVMACGRQKSLTVSEVIQNAKSLNGETIRVSGKASLGLTRLAQKGGCLEQESEPILENIDPKGSSRLVDGKWIPIQHRDFGVMFL